MQARDDVALLRFARENGAFLVSNDRFDDHIGFMMRYGRGTRKWIARRRLGFRFVVPGAVSADADFVLVGTPLLNRGARQLVARG